MSEKTVSYEIEADIPVKYVENLLDHIYQKHLLPQKARFTRVSKTQTEGTSSLSFAVQDQTGTRILDVRILGTIPLKISITPTVEAVKEDTIEEVKEDIKIAVNLFEEKVRANTLYFAWREGENIVPEKMSGKERRPINRVLLETQVFLSVIFITIGLFLFAYLGPLWWAAPIILLVLQFVILFYSSRLIEIGTDWRITKDNPTLHLLEYRLPLQEQDSLQKSFPKEKLASIKKEIYQQTIQQRGEIDCQTTQQIFSNYGIQCSPENLAARKVNVYELVEKTARKFGFPMPKIVVSNTLIPNAAASGPSPRRGIVLITTGLLAQLEENEIISVLGHEFGHLKGHDPLALFGLTGAEFLFRFYVLLPFFPIVFTSLLFIVYFWAVMTLIYFIAKFFEARADLTSAIVVGQPRVLAEALEKIGFKRLLYERVPSYRIQEWISLDPHPPMYFRIHRLRKLGETPNVKHPLFQSAREVTRGFLDSLSTRL
jgi:heat shock protein HtpX